MANETARPKFKRTQYLVQKKFQLKYVGLILALTFLTAVLCSYVVYYTMMINLGEKLASVYPQGRLVSIVKIVNFRICLSVLLISPFMALIGILLSHKIAGPIFRMETFLKNMTAGDLTSRITLRSGDELISLADGINNAAGALRASFQRQRSQMDKVLAELNSLKDLAREKHQDPSRISSTADRVDDELRPIIAELDKYKL
ncbi:MAG: methyl-accepting chemotaxis protein [Candidatus Omnitrophica bacterium]|nr:methyl-accepting chemotaxis protein [Candidatus Omnitrophota bacterium]